MNKEIYVIGVGPYTAVIIELAEICGYNVSGLYHFDDSMNGDTFHGIEVISSIEEAFEKGIENKSFSLSMGDNNIRTSLSKRIFEKNGFIPNLIHPTVEISKSATIGQGIILKRNVSIQALSVVNDFTIICDNSTICHHSTIGTGSFIAGSVIIGAYTHVGDFAFFGQGAIVPSGKAKNIGNSSIIGAGSNVIKPVDDFEVVAGNPAKRIKFKD